MSVINKINPVGIDTVIDDLQELLYSGLTAKGWTNYDSYPRVYKNETKDGLIPEFYTSKGDYQEVYFDDRINASSFWLVDDSTEQQNNPNYTAKVKVVFQANLDKLYNSISHRADEEMHKDVSLILDDSMVVSRYNKKITTGIKKIYNEEGLSSTDGFEDMSYYHVVKFDMEVTFRYKC